VLGPDYANVGGDLIERSGIRKKIQALFHPVTTWSNVDCSRQNTNRSRSDSRGQFGPTVMQIVSQ